MRDSLTSYDSYSVNSSPSPLLSSQAGLWQTYDKEDMSPITKQVRISPYLVSLSYFFPIASLVAIAVTVPVSLHTSQSDTYFQPYDFTKAVLDVYIINITFLVILIAFRFYLQSYKTWMILVSPVLTLNIVKLALYSEYTGNLDMTISLLLMFTFISLSCIITIISKSCEEGAPKDVRDEKRPNHFIQRIFTSREKNSQQGDLSESLLGHEAHETHGAMKDIEQGSPNQDGNADNSKKDMKASLRRLFSLATSEKWYLFYGSIALFVSSAATLAQPLFFGLIIQICSNTSSQSDDVKQLTRYTVILLLILAVGSVATTIRGYFYTVVGERLVRTIRKQLFDSLVRQDIAFFDVNKTGELINRLSSDTAVIQSCLSVNISMGLRAVATVIVSIILLFITSWKLTFVMMGVVPLLVISVAFYGRITKRLTKEYQDALANATDKGTETISNIRITRSFGAEFFEMWRYGDSINNSYQLGKTRAGAYGVFAGGILMLANAAILIVVYYGARLVISDELDVGDLTSFILYTVYIAMGLGMFGELYTELMNAVGASERIFDIMDTKSEIPIAGGIWPDDKENDENAIKFSDVSFFYPTRKDVTVLRDFSLNIERNQTVALVGPSGSGKSTVLGLIERFYDIPQGSIRINGYDIKQLDLRWLHRYISIVPQEPILFSGSILSNLAYSRYAFSPELVCDEELRNQCEAVAKLANAHDFIMSFPDGYNTIVGERGVRLSGGQKQRIAIARALLADPKILLLDEATSALDSESEHLVQDAIDKLMKNRTVIVIAHRLSTVRDADVIAVVSNGSILDKGRHVELLQSSEVYANLMKRQLSWANQDEHVHVASDKSPNTDP